jgi:uncharacterized protein (DUF1330 family)
MLILAASAVVFALFIAVKYDDGRHLKKIVYLFFTIGFLLILFCVARIFCLLRPGYIQLSWNGCAELAVQANGQQSFPAVIAAQKAAGGRPFNTGGGRIVAMDGAAAPKRLAITEWDSLEQAQAYYNSAAWKNLAPQRDKATKTIRRYTVEAVN